MNYLNIILIFIFLIIIIIIDNYLRKRKRNKLLGDLTGKYIHIKKPSGNVLYVQHKNPDKTKEFKEASFNDIKVLKDLKIIKYVV